MTNAQRDALVKRHLALGNGYLALAHEMLAAGIDPRRVLERADAHADAAEMFLKTPTQILILALGMQR